MGRKAKRRAAKRARQAKVPGSAPALTTSSVVKAIDVQAEARARIAEVLRTTAPLSWYMLRVYGGERGVEEALKHRGFDVYVPRETLKAVRLGKPVKIVRPIFYGYVFVCIDHNSGQRFDQVSSLEHGVAGFLRRAGTDQPRMMRPWYVERLRLMEEFGLFDRREAAARVLADGDLIWLVGGEYRDHFAQVLRVTKGEKRVRLLLDAMGAGETEVEAVVDVEHVRVAWSAGRGPKVGEAA